MSDMADNEFQERVEALDQQVSLLKERFKHEEKILKFLTTMHRTPDPGFVPVSEWPHAEDIPGEDLPVDDPEELSTAELNKFVDPADYV